MDKVLFIVQLFVKGLSYINTNKKSPQFWIFLLGVLFACGGGYLSVQLGLSDKVDAAEFKDHCMEQEHRVTKLESEVLTQEQLDQCLEKVEQRICISMRREIDSLEGEVIHLRNRVDHYFNGRIPPRSSSRRDSTR
jgi:hypothetical protein